MVPSLTVQLNLGAGFKKIVPMTCILGSNDAILDFMFHILQQLGMVCMYTTHKSDWLTDSALLKYTQR